MNEPAGEPSAAAPKPLPFVRPAEYYSRPERVRIFPRWLPFGCGTLSVIVLIVLFTGGAMVGSGKAGALLDRFFGMMQDDVDAHFAKNVPAAKRAQFDAGMHLLRAKLRRGDVKLEALQPLLREMSESENGGTVSPEETQRLIDAVHAVNAAGTK